MKRMAGCMGHFQLPTALYHGYCGISIMACRNLYNWQIIYRPSRFVKSLLLYRMTPWTYTTPKSILLEMKGLCDYTTPLFS